MIAKREIVMKSNPSLLEADDSTLIVIDVQDKFLQRLDGKVAARVVGRIEWLVQVANWLQVPTVVTAEEIDAMGPTTDAIRRWLPDDNPDMDKLVFGLAGQVDILERVDEIGRKTTVLAGLETDVCVSQSAIGLAAAGYRVAVVADACASPEDGHAHGLDRMRDAGIAVISTKGLFFEWVRDVEKCHEFFRNSGIGIPKDLYIG